MYKNIELKTLPSEEWKDIIGYNGDYKISNLGRVKSMPKLVKLFHGGSYKTKERILKQRNSAGYLFVALFLNGNRKDIQVHILVASAFIPNQESKKEVNHIHGITDDNRVSELEWCTHQENILHAYKIGLNKPSQSGKFGLAHPSAKKLQCLLTGGIFSIEKAAAWLNISKTHMISMLKGKRTNWTNFIYY